MSILISPSDNTGWGIGTSLLRGTGLRYRRAQPVPVHSYYRSQWGQLNGRVSKARLLRNLRKYARLHRERVARRRRRREEAVVVVEEAPRRRRGRSTAAARRRQRMREAVDRIKAFNAARRVATEPPAREEVVVTETVSARPPIRRRRRRRRRY
ncbi:pVII [Bearded dragon adenovirus 1]|uniref:PVII n=1 Tax=Bearded dragon adenovirus 1 TaxID=2729647 RepID=A0A6M4MJH4_9ADEN|nr:pVII [Bearded dragon adenovirus 1]QJR83093.1 pVII [Bearded dragon adenovirus 1]QPN96212.1 pVII [Bearded dragon adenovirus 1]